MKKITYIFLLGLAFSATSYAQEKAKSLTSAKELKESSLPKEEIIKRVESEDLKTIASSISDLSEEQKTRLSRTLSLRSRSLKNATTEEEKTQIKKDFGTKIYNILTDKQKAELEKNEAAYKNFIKGL